MMEYVQIRSWHIVRTWTRVPNRAITLCGRTAAGDTSPDLPAEKSCESCLRIAERNRA